MDDPKTMLIPIPVRPHKYPVVEKIISLAKSAHESMVKGLEQEIRHTLQYARGMNKGFYINVPMTDELRKATKPPKPKKPGEKKREPTKPSKAGTRGSTHWYVDDHNIVRYGDRPTPRFSKNMTQDELDAWLKSSQPFFQFGQYEEVLDALRELGVSSKTLQRVETIADILAKSPFGENLEEVFTNEFTLSGMDPKEALEEFHDLQNRLVKAGEDLNVQKALKAAMDSEEEDQKDVLENIDETREHTDGVVKKWFDTHPDTAAMQMLATAIQLGIVTMVEKKGDLPKGMKDNFKELEARIWSRSPDVPGLRQYVDAMSDAQIAAMAFADQIAADRYKTYDDDVVEQAKKGVDFWTRALQDRMKSKTLDEFDVKDKFKAILDRAAEQLQKYDSNQGGIAVAKLFSDDDLCEAIFQGKAGVTKKVEALTTSDAEYTNQVAAALAAQDNDKDPADGFSKEFTDALKKNKISIHGFQKKYINWMLTIKRGINAADTAMGKTLMTIAMVDNLIKNKKSERGILILPPSLIAQWPNEIQKFRPGSKTYVIDDKLDMQERTTLLEGINNGSIEADFVIMSAGLAKMYDKTAVYKKMGIKVNEDDEVISGGEGKGGTLSPMQEARFAELRLEDPWAKQLTSMKGAIFYDEAHMGVHGLKTPGNLGREMAKQVIGDREYAFFLTATPITNTPVDLFNLMELVHPGSAGGNEAKFLGKIGKWERNKETGALELTGYQNLRTLNNEIRPFCYARLKTEKEVAAQLKLPKSHDKTLALSMSADQAKFYDKAMSELIGAFKKHEGANTFTQILMLIHQMRQAAISPKLLNDENGKPIVYTGKSVKYEATKNIIKKHFNNPANTDHPIVIFCSYSKAFESLKEEITRDLHIDPSLFAEISANSDEDRSLVQEAANLGKKKIIFCGIAAGGAGLNLQGMKIKDPKTGKEKFVGPSQMIFLDKPWSPFQIEQARGRLIRPGQQEEVVATHMRVLGTHDDYLLDKLHGKVEAARGILYAHLGENELVEVTNDSMGKILSDFMASDKKGAEVKFSEFKPQTQKDSIEAMGGILGTDPKATTTDEVVAQSMGMSIHAPEWKKLRERMSKMTPGELTKLVFDEGDLKRNIAERQYLQMGESRIKARQVIAQLDLKSKRIKPTEYKALADKYAKELKVWQASMDAGKQLKAKDLSMAHAVQAMGKGKQAVVTKPAKALKPGWQVKTNPYKAGSEHAMGFKIAQKHKLKTEAAFVKQCQKEYEGPASIYQKIWRKFVSDGHVVEGTKKSLVVDLDTYVASL